MRTRRRHEEEHESHDRWLVSYADFITLLFAFFVVMYAVSSVNEGKYRVLSDSLDAMFKARDRSASPVNVGEPPRVPLPNTGTPYPGVEVGEPTPATVAELEAAGHEPSGTGREFEPQPKVVAQKLRDDLNELVKKGTVSVIEGDGWVEVEIKSQILFDSGSAKVKEAAAPALREVARAISGYTNGLQVEGYTDNTPISTAAFASNWELSSARAASVVQLFGNADVDPARMAAVGYGEFRPKAGNDTLLGRQQNRRVIVRVSTLEKDAVSASPDTATIPDQAVPVAPDAGTPAAETPKSPAATEAAAEDPAQSAAAAAAEAAQQPATPPAEVKSINDRPGREGPDL